MAFRSVFKIVRNHHTAFPKLNPSYSFQSSQKTSRHLSTSRYLSSSTSTIPPLSPSTPLPPSLSPTTPSTGSYLLPPPSTPLLPTDATQTVVEQLNALGEPTLSSLGLASWYPNGLIQFGLEHLHVALDVPWWAAIAIGTVILRVSTFPIVVLSQRNAANMHNHMPIVQKLQEKFTKAKNTGNMLDAARHGSALYNYMKANKVNPVKNMLVPMIQLPIFLSVFMGLRQMANLPVESMVTAGLLWFPDLTSPDPFYILPVITMATFAVTVELGVDGVRAKSMSRYTRLFMRAFPLLILPFSINFPSALLVYWFSSNTVSLLQVLLLKIPNVKEGLGIPPMVEHQKSSADKKPFVESLKSTWKNSKVVVNVEEMQKREAVRFKEAGLGAIHKTYQFDPTNKNKT